MAYPTRRDTNRLNPAHSPQVNSMYSHVYKSMKLNIQSMEYVICDQCEKAQVGWNTAEQTLAVRMEVK